jgi:hypothetical protein
LADLADFSVRFGFVTLMLSGDAKSLWVAKPFLRTLLQVERHENAVRVEYIAGERKAFEEAVVSIERSCGDEMFGRAGFKAEAGHTACARGLNNVVKHRGSRASSAHGLNRVHRFNFAMIRGELLQSAEA